MSKKKDEKEENTSDDKKTEEIKYQTYINERSSLISAERESSQYFDKAILTLAAGALGLSLTFIDKIVPHPNPSTLCLLIIAWIFFCASVLSTLISFITSQFACRKQINILEKEFFGNNSDKKDECNILGGVTAFLNIASISLFVLGVIFLIFFSAKNIDQMKGEIKMSNGNKPINEGYVPPKTPQQPQQPQKPSFEREQRGYVPPNPPVQPPQEKPKK